MDADLFAAAMRGRYSINGFRNGEFAAHPGVRLSEDKTERKWQAPQICLLQLVHPFS